MDWNETLDSASFQVNCIPGLNEAAVKGSEGLRQRDVCSALVALRREHLR